MKNPVAKYAKKFNKGGPMRDRKKDSKRGYMKHKGKQQKEDGQQTDTTGHTNAAAKKPQDYIDPKDGKKKVRMVPVHKDVQNEKLDPSQGIKAYIDDFKKSDAPQFKGKSDAKKKEMAIAAYLDAKKGEKKEDCWDGYKRVGMKKKGGKMVPNCVPEGYNPRAARAQSHAANKMYGRTSDPIDKKPASAAKKPISKVDLFRAIDKKYGSAKKKTGIFATRKEETQMDEGNPKLDQHPEVKKRFNAIKRTKPDSYERRRAVRRWSNKRKELMNNEDAEARARLKLKHTKEKENLKNRHSKEREAMKESMDPRDFTDKPGHVVVVKKKDGTKSIKHYHPTSAGAKKYADRVNKVNKVGDKATVHKTDGRKIHEASQKLTNKKAELRKKMFGNANYLSPAQRKELDKAAKAALKKDSESKKAAPAKPVSKTSKGKVRTGSADPADRNIFMQLRKAQDRGGNQAITVSPTGKKVTLNPKQIDMLLKRHDSLQKPVEKRKFKIMLIKSLRKKAK